MSGRDMSGQDMTADGTAEVRLAELLSRIERATTDTSPAAEPLTGRLADLQAWWATTSGGADLDPVRVQAPAPSGSRAIDALLEGASAADRAVDSGATLVVPHVPWTEDITALTVIALLTRREANRVVGQPTGMTDGIWMERCAAVRDRAAAGAAHLGDQMALLDALDAPAIAATAGVLLGAAARRTPCLIVGTDEWAAALVADRMNHVARQWWRPATTSPDPAQEAAADRTGLEPLLPLELSDDVGLGAHAVIALLRLTEASAR